MIDRREIKHFHLFCGLGGGARGFNAGQARVGKVSARLRCIGGVDTDRAALADFRVLAGVPGTYLDLFDRDQYIDWHGHEPPDDWREASPEDLQRAAGGRRPDVVFTSPPCKGYSGLLSAAKSGSDKYQALNRLTIRGFWLALEAWKDDPPAFFIMENVPRILTRGRHFLDQIIGVLQQYGYAVAETTHDCGELGGLGQKRKRFLLVARHREKVPPFLYEPPKKKLLTVGDVLGRFPLPDDPRAGPMHSSPRLQWRTWVRLALVLAGADWRSLERLEVEAGNLKDYGIVPVRPMFRTAMGVCLWDEPSGTVTSTGRVFNGQFSVADPCLENGHPRSVQLGVRPWNQTAATVTSQAYPGQGPNSAADPRLKGANPRFNNIYRVVEWDGPSGAVTSGGGPSAGGQAIADPRHQSGFESCLGVMDWEETSGAICSRGQPTSGKFSIADPRSKNWDHAKYRVTDWDESTGTVISASTTGQGAFALADPRVRIKSDRTSDPRVPDATELPSPTQNGAWIIRALDGTWHRPFTTLELAALQGLVEPNEHFDLDGKAHSAWRARIGNAVPAPAAQAIASVIGQTLLLAWTGQRQLISDTPIWVRPVAVAMAVDL